MLWSPIRPVIAFALIARVVWQAVEGLFVDRDSACPNTRNLGPSNDTPIPDQSTPEVRASCSRVLS